MARGTNVVLASAARTTSGVSAGFAQNTSEWAGVAEKYGNISLMVDVTAVSGTTPSMALSVEWSWDNSTWFVVDGTADTFAAIDDSPATLSVVKNFTVKGQYFRVRYAITGTTPSFTFSIRSQGWEGSA